MKIFAAGISTETNTFCPIPTTIGDFRIQTGSDVLRGKIDHPDLDLSAVWGPLARERGCELIFGAMACAQPAGMTSVIAYESLRDRLLAELQVAMPVDVVLLMLHGAMVAVGYDDCEQDIICRVREVVGSDAVIGVELDLHCHLSESKLAKADIVITYKEFPHTDGNVRARELFDLAVDTKAKKIRPTMALFDCRMVGIFPTTQQPMRDFVDTMARVERRPGMLSVSLGHGFQFADLPHIGAKVIAISDGDPNLAKEVARELGQYLYSIRHRIAFDRVSLPMDVALSKAASSSSWPIVVADQSDNSGGGAPGDATFALRWLLEHNISHVAYATFYDPEVVKIAKKAGCKAKIPVRLGGKLGRLSGNPVDLEVSVLGIQENYRYAFPLEFGQYDYVPTGDVVSLRCGDIDIVVSSERCQVYSTGIFSDLGIDFSKKRILVVKSTQHFYAAFAPIAAEVIYMSAPGAVAPDPKSISYQNVRTTALFPWLDNPWGI